MKQMLLRFGLLLPLIPALALECHPAGVVMYFMNANGPDFKSTFSYFSLTPFGYGQYGPILTALITCVLALLAVLFLFRPRRGLRKAIFFLSIAAVLASLLQLTLGLRWFTWINAAVTALMLCETAVALFLGRSTPQTDR
jgi:hypothetical protein